MTDFSVAGLALVLEDSSVEFADFQPESYRLFQVSGPIRNAVQIEVRQGPTMPPREGRKIFSQGDSWALFRDASDYVLVVEPRHEHQPRACVRFHPNCRHASLTFSAGTSAGGDSRPMHPFTYPIDRLMIVYYLASRAGLLMHAAGGIISGGGFVFAGLSGAGKSTLAKLLAESKDCEILSDERVAVRRIEGYQVFGTPWHGDGGFASPSQAPLTGVIFLRHGSKNRMSRLPTSEAVPMLLPLVSVAWFDREILEPQLRFLEQLVATIPCYRFDFLPQAEAVACLRSFVSERA
ncbi:MAG: hypothetical protein ACE15E_15620 [Acidobacteriota bacterium]